MRVNLLHQPVLPISYYQLGEILTPIGRSEMGKSETKIHVSNWKQTRGYICERNYFLTDKHQHGAPIQIGKTL